MRESVRARSNIFSRTCQVIIHVTRLRNNFVLFLNYIDRYVFPRGYKKGIENMEKIRAQES